MIYLPEANEPRIQEAYERCLSLGIDVMIPHEADTIENAMTMLKNNEIDGVVCGIQTSSADVLRAAIKIVGAKELVSSYFIMQKDDERLLFADCAVIPNPSSGQLAQIAIDTAHSARLNNIVPKVAFLSFSTEQSARGTEVEKIRDAIRLLDTMHVDFEYAGEWQFDTAYNVGIRRNKVDTDYFDNKPANVFIFPDLNAGNIAYKVAQQLGGYVAVGPLLQGLNKPVNDLSRGATVEDIVQVIMVTDTNIQNNTL